ncbi:hypothetical protein A7U60_g1514 [Sanghuangporus baumii]|uniref:Uncharacterized protein n=1 Tax=Sanghuangporus baumii TaxID=108892 RepID=A0A9Q5I3W1_SANBA|nr:hypothetical protein A7U60_g1514 [Sanghuangporus baumii]
MSTPSSSTAQGEEKKKMYKQPDQPLAALLWRLSLWISVTFGLSVMEPWEKLLVGLGFVRFIPQFISVSFARMRYYTCTSSGRIRPGLGLLHHIHVAALESVSFGSLEYQSYADIPTSASTFISFLLTYVCISIAIHGIL